ncbi:Zinc finger protein 524 [Dissostichus eleginoides]|uniref:Zinc finger protein 524 n=1 Tax=Dissostichus eleginoides TaxID=100907 RepID=A0AAD9C4J9_DISEL|nr:Zinc finger protein 524 [Dissostichus eleginoides]
MIGEPSVRNPLSYNFGSCKKYKWVCPKMDSQLASVLTSGSLDVQNGSQCAEGSGPEVCVDPKEIKTSSTVPGNPEPCPVRAAVTTRQDAPSINGNKPEVGTEEQTEPLDLSLPNKRERRCERFLDDSGCESSLIMEVDEYEGEGDRDIVEEDEDVECSALHDLGIPYTLSPDGLKVPQVDASESEDQAEGMGSPLLATLANPSLSQITQTTPGASTPMFLLLSSVPSSSGDPTSTPIAVLDPYTGQLSQITAASAPVSLPLPSTLPMLSHPVIRLSPNHPPAILSGATNVTSVLASLSVPSPSLQNDRLTLHSQISSSDSNPGSEAISSEEVSSEIHKPSTFTASSPHPQSASLTYVPLAQPSSEAQSPASESRFDPSDLQSEHLPLDDHLYFSSAAPPSPPIGPILSSDNLDPLDPLDPLSPEGSQDDMGARRVLYCQLCPRVFFYLSDLERHAITHSQKKPHVCQQCGKAFKRSSHLQRHKHIHTGQRNFVCPICSKRFREAGELQRHQRVHTGEKPYQCQLCHTRFAERNTLRRHTKRKHPYHQVAMEMLNERRDRGDGGGGVQEEEESAEWYSSTVSILDNSESETET